MIRPLHPSVYLLLLALMISVTARAQDPITFSQFFANPYQFNPSFAAQTGKGEMNLMLRQQWVGIENAPKAATFNVQSPVGRNVSLAGAVNVSQTVLVKSGSVMGTFAYRVRLGNYHHLNFGLTIGASMNRFNLAAIPDASQDGTLNTLVTRNTAALGQFGFNYQYKNLNIGFALPQLLDTRAVSVKEFQELKFDPFKAKFGSISYNMYVSRDIQISPIVIFRSLDNVQYQIEGMVTATFRNAFWIGASYRDGFGVTGFVGFKMKNILRAGYAYEKPVGNSLSNAVSATHEIYAGMRLGTRDREAEYFEQKKTKDSLAQAKQDEVVVEETKEEVKKEEPKKEQPKVEEKKIEEPVVTLKAKTDSLATVPRVTENVVTPPVTTTTPEVKPQTKKPVYSGYYVIVGAFKKQSNAMKEMTELRDQGLYPDMMYMLEHDFYYVYLYHSSDRDQAIKELNKARTRIPKAWLFLPTEDDAPKLDK